jgi:phosphoglycerol transferase MdoB-like AlkP superfamily enzyme
VVRLYLSGAVVVITFLECAAWPSLREFGSRPEALFIEYLKYGGQVVAMVLSGFLLETVVTIAAIGVIAWFAHRRLARATLAPWPRWGVRLLVFPVGAALLFAGARSSFSHRPANLSSASFSRNHFHNELALNSTYTLGYAVYRRKHETDTARDYGSLPVERIFELTKRHGPLPAEGYLPAGNGQESTLRVQQPAVPRSGPPPNIVIILLESFGAEYTGPVGRAGLTPNFDRLAREGVSFTRLFSTGTRTSRGIEAVISGFFPTPARSVVKLGLARNGFFTTAELFRREGYRTHFIYGGESNFDEMKSFFAGNGIETISDQPVLQKPGHAVGVWGIHDEDVLNEADALFRSQDGQPFFAVVLSTSNHTPFDYPAGRIEPNPDFPVASAENAIKYTDHALGQFFAKASTADYFKNTIFLVVADHGTRVSGDQLIPLYKFEIPAMIYGPRELIPNQVVQTLASQVDLIPTVLGLTGRPWLHPMMGRNLLDPAEQASGRPGRTLLQYENHFGYWKDDTLVVLRPGLPPSHFLVETTDQPGRDRFQLHPAPPDAALAEEALAHSLLPGHLYRERLYHLPQSDGPRSRPDPRGATRLSATQDSNGGR